MCLPRAFISMETLRQNSKLCSARTWPHSGVWWVIRSSSRSGTLQGLVVKAGTSEAVPNARVELRRVDVGRGANYATTAREDGRFSFRNLQSGHYEVVASRGGYIAVRPLSITIETEKEPDPI